MVITCHKEPVSKFHRSSVSRVVHNLFTVAEIRLASSHWSSDNGLHSGRRHIFTCMSQLIAIAIPGKIFQIQFLLDTLWCSRRSLSYIYNTCHCYHVNGYTDVPINHMSNAHTGQGRELLGLKLGSIGKIVLGSAHKYCICGILLRSEKS